MTSTQNDAAKTDDIAPAVPMATAAAFALVDDEEESKRLAESFRQAIEPRPAMPSR